MYQVFYVVCPADAKGEAAVSSVTRGGLALPWHFLASRPFICKFCFVSGFSGPRDVLKIAWSMVAWS